MCGDAQALPGRGCSSVGGDDTRFEAPGRCCKRSCSKGTSSGPVASVPMVARRLRRSPTSRRLLGLLNRKEAASNPLRVGRRRVDEPMSVDEDPVDPVVGNSHEADRSGGIVAGADHGLAFGSFTVVGEGLRLVWPTPGALLLKHMISMEGKFQLVSRGPMIARRHRSST